MKRKSHLSVSFLKIFNFNSDIDNIHEKDLSWKWGNSVFENDYENTFCGKKIHFSNACFHKWYIEKNFSLHKHFLHNIQIIKFRRYGHSSMWENQVLWGKNVKNVLDSISIRANSIFSLFDRDFSKWNLQGSLGIDNLEWKFFILKVFSQLERVFYVLKVKDTKM